MTKRGVVDAPIVHGLTFITPGDDDKGYLIWARIGGAWQRYEHTDTFVDAERLARKTDHRFREAARRRLRDG